MSNLAPPVEVSKVRNDILTKGCRIIISSSVKILAWVLTDVVLVSKLTVSVKLNVVLWWILDTQFPNFSWFKRIEIYF